MSRLTYKEYARIKARQELLELANRTLTDIANGSHNAILVREAKQFVKQYKELDNVKS